MAPHSIIGNSFEETDTISPYHSYPSTLRDQDKLEAIAIVGFSLRFPEDAISAESFWDMLMEKRCTAKDFPEDRLGVSGIYHPDPNRRGTVRRALAFIRCFIGTLVHTSSHRSLPVEDTFSKTASPHLTHLSSQSQPLKLKP